jgi:hypothetical protein
MNDSLQLYRTLLTAFCQHIPRANYADLRHLYVLAWGVVGLCMTETVNFNRWGEGVISLAKYAGSHQRYFQRWLKNGRIKPLKLY